MAHRRKRAAGMAYRRKRAAGMAYRRKRAAGMACRRKRLKVERGYETWCPRRRPERTDSHEL